MTWSRSSSCAPKETRFVLQGQIKSSQSELESERVALSQAQERSEALQRALDESLEHEAEAV